MNVTTALRPARKFLTAIIVTAVTATCLVSAASGHSAPSPAGHVQAKKEYRISPDKKEYSAKKEYRISPDKKEYSLLA